MQGERAVFTRGTMRFAAVVLLIAAEAENTLISPDKTPTDGAYEKKLCSNKHKVGPRGGHNVEPFYFF